MIKIDKGIPAPSSERNSKYPWREMQVGDSFFVPETTQSRLTGAASGARRREPEKSWVTRQEGDGVRVWRVK